MSSNDKTFQSETSGAGETLPLFVLRVVINHNTWMMYLASTSSSLMGHCDTIGVMIGPRSGGVGAIKEGRKWGGDNDAFHGKFTEKGFLKHLKRLHPYRENCLFVAAPDVVCDPAATAELFAHWGPRIRGLGFPVAWVAQDGALPSDIPDCDSVFIGGTTEWKLGSDALAICESAKEKGLWVHIGRVNSARRSALAARMGADSVDGTYISFVGIERGLADIASWTRTAQFARPQRRLL